MTSFSVAGAAKSLHLSPPQIKKLRSCPSISFLRTTQLSRKQRPASHRWASSTDGPITALSSEASSSSGLYSAKVYELTAENVNLVLDDVRPYLIADGGNVDVVSVEDGVISLQLQGLIFFGGIDYLVVDLIWVCGVLDELLVGFVIGVGFKLKNWIFFK